MLNHCVFIGRLTREPELKYLPSGIAITKFSLAVDRNFKNKAGEKEADFIDIIVWRQLAEICANNLDKGRLVSVEGALQIRSYTDKEGNKRRAAEIIADNVYFLDYKKDNASGSNQGQNQSSGEGSTSFGHEVNLDDDPFLSTK